MKFSCFSWALAWLIVVLGFAPAPAKAIPVQYWQECTSNFAGAGASYCALGRDQPEAIQNLAKAACGNFYPTAISCAFLAWERSPAYPTGYLVVSFCRDANYCSNSGGGTNGRFSTWETCSIATALTGKCGRVIAQLRATTPRDDDPTRIFHKTQTCIAGKSCALRCTMDDCDWLNEVVPFFVNRYLIEVDDWAAVKAACRAAAGPLNTQSQEIYCAGLEGAYHIANDLVPALTRYGCGSDSDWEKVYGAIKTCAAESMSGYFPGAATVSQSGVYALRQGARAVCITQRSLAGLPINVNPPLKGQVCTP